MLTEFFAYPVSTIALLSLLGLAIKVIIDYIHDLRRPGPIGLPFFGDLPFAIYHMDRLYDWFVDIQKQYPGGWYHRVMHNRITALADPADIKYILRTNWENFQQGPGRNEIFADFLGKGIFNIDGHLWYAQRKTSSREFAVRKFRQFTQEVFQSHGEQVQRIVQQHATTGDAFDMQELASKFTLDSIGSIAFGCDLGNLTCQGTNQFAEAFDLVNRLIYQRFMDPIWKLKRLVGIGSEAQLHVALHAIKEYSMSVIRKRRSLSSAELVEKSDLLSRFMDALDSDPLPDNPTPEALYLRSDEYLRDIVLSFFLAGRDTTANGLSWCLYLIAKHPEVEERIVAELEAKVPGDSLYELTYDTLSDLTYLRAVIQEQLRLYPSVPDDAKWCMKDDVMPSGLKVYEGEWVSFVPYAMGRNEELWGPDAKEFKPERWIGPDGKIIQHSIWKYPVFLAGPRQCLGIDLAKIEMASFLATVLRRFHFKLVPGHPVQYAIALTLPMKYGLQMTVEPRVR